MKIDFRKFVKESVHIVRVSCFLSLCKGCGEFLVSRDERLICRECRTELTLNRDLKCRICGRIMNNGYERCGECILDPPPFRKHISYSRYRGLLKKLILLYKYGGVEKLKYLFADLYVELFNGTFVESFDWIIPVPPDKSRKREFDPILEVSVILSRRLGIDLLPGHLIKRKQTLPQAGLSRSKRMKNLDGAFKLRGPEEITKKKVLLIDDVYTTGTTIFKCARLLTKHAAEVAAMTLARS